MRFTLGLVFVFFTVVLLACPPSSPPGEDGGSSSSTDGGNLDAGPGSWPPELTSVEAQVSGRVGLDLRFAVQGRDRDLNIVGLWVRLLDAQGAPVLGIDANRDGTPDSAEGPASIENPKLIGEALTATATLKRLFVKAPAVFQVAVVLQDATGLRSNELTVPVTAQPIVTMGESCDPLFLADRCAAGLGCRGEPPTCQEGLAPAITRMAFYKATGGPTILLEGTEPEDDLDIIRFGFQDAQGKPISIDSDGDGTPDMASFDLDAKGGAVDGTFFIRLQGGDGLDQQVSKLTATGSDIAGHQGATKTASPSSPPVRSSGQACDPRGFDVCGTNLVCSPGFVGQTNKCASAATLRASQCKAAPVLVATAAGATLIGNADGVSLWDTPAGCQSADPKGRPEGLVTLRLTARANRLILSTENPGTTFDTALYMLTGCPANSKDTFGCSDDVPNGAGASQLVLEGVPAGDYLVVVDSYNFEGGSFVLSAIAE